MATEYRAYDELSQWRGPVRATIEEAERDIDRRLPKRVRVSTCGAIARYVVIESDEFDRSYYAGTNDPVWPDHGRGCGAVRFSREGQERDSIVWEVSDNGEG